MQLTAQPLRRADDFEATLRTSIHCTRHSAHCAPWQKYINLVYASRLCCLMSCEPSRAGAVQAGQALKIMNEKGAHTYAQIPIHIKYILYTAYTGRMKMHLKCNNKNDNGIIILYKGTQTEKDKREREQGTAFSGAHFMPMPESMLHYLQLVNFYSLPRCWWLNLT